MNIRELFHYSNLISYEMDGWITKRKHPSLPLYIYNYTHKTQLESKWDKVTRLCRGLILDQFGEIVARPFMKFFNLNTTSEPSTMVDNLPADLSPLIMEKMDGSLGILWRWNGYEGVATRGSFDSEQAQWATAFYQDSVVLKHPWEVGATPLFEIIYPENRIVLDYGGKKSLTLLGIVRKDGSEYSYQELLDTGYADIIKVWEGKSVSDCVEESLMDVPFNREGYVLKYDQEPYPLRVKIKFTDYIRLHKLIFTLSDKTIYEFAMSGGIPEDFLSLIPDDAECWATNKQKEFVTIFHMYRSLADRLFAKRPMLGSRKDNAMYFKEYPEIQSVLFAMLDGKDSDAVIWKKIKPEHTTHFRSRGWSDDEELGTNES